MIHKDNNNDSFTMTYTTCRDILCTMYMGQVWVILVPVQTIQVVPQDLKGSIEVYMWKRIPESREIDVWWC